MSPGIFEKVILKIAPFCGFCTNLPGWGNLAENAKRPRAFAKCSETWSLALFGHFQHSRYSRERRRPSVNVSDSGPACPHTLSSSKCHFDLPRSKYKIPLEIKREERQGMYFLGRVLKEERRVRAHIFWLVPSGATWQNTACTVVYVDEIQAKTSSNDEDTRIKVMLLLLLLLMMLVVVMMMVKNDWDANQDCEDTR